MGKRFFINEKMLSGTFFIFFILVCFSACSGGVYGFARHYKPLRAERDLWEKSKKAPVLVVTRDPDDYIDDIIGWFGIVEEIKPHSDEKHLVSLSHHTHKKRHLCKGESSKSCRVTVNFKSTGGFSVLLKLNPGDVTPDLDGLDKVQPGSLLRIYGKVMCKTDEEERTNCEYDENGQILLDGIFYRQWPARHYSTTRSSTKMRR